MALQLNDRVVSREGGGYCVPILAQCCLYVNQRVDAIEHRQ